MNLTPENNNLYQHFKKNYFLWFLIVFPIFVILGLYGFKIPNDAYFYTFSTIAQTLAALLAFIGMFVVSKLDKIKTDGEKCLNDIESIYDTQLKPHKDTYEPQTTYYELCNIECMNSKELIDNISELLLKLKTTPADHHPGRLKHPISKLNYCISSIERNKNLHHNLRKRYDTSLSFGFTAITISIISLSLGWVYKPGINFNIHSVQMIPLSFAIYFALVSIYGLALIFETALEIVDDAYLYF